MINVSELTYTYAHGSRPAIRDISFEVEKGEVFALLGPSGAGKSTTQGILTGLLPLQGGRAEVAGYDLRHRSRQLFNQIGVSFEQSNVYSKLTALENLVFYRRLFDTATLEPEDLLKMVGLDQVANQKAASFSKGMKHRLTFARSLINQPALWFLDEPTTGLDPAIAAQIREIILERKQSGTTILLTTHNMVLAEQLSDRIGFIVEGELKLVDTPRNLKLRYGERLVQVEYRENNQSHKELLSLTDEQERLRLQTIIGSAEIEIMHTREASLEEIFIKVTGRELI
ncbi:MAG: ABC transporter ATP-binding protein [Clostridia bacterium]|nr:ABC transporter ATP-binding protein [Eubacteriales bacterium]MDD3867868.1 ABC transporter ATP-binding protein [Eubacteriales bacterium]MDD4462278.1 ABC transporter ATP-binding protein [Eubacteriales bacterium]NCC47725.1 ABC transporter ATP-binding protein [Clostridia bacterium]